MTAIWRHFFGVLLAGLLHLAATGHAASDPQVIDRRAFLDQAAADYQAGYISAARQRLKYLLRSSPDAQDEAFVLGLYHGIGRAHPWFASANASVLPSTNIAAASSKRIFSTEIGDFSINDGGNAKSGVSFRGAVSFGRRFNIGPGQEAVFAVNFGRTASTFPLLNQSEAFLSATYESLGRWGSLSLTPSVGMVKFDQARPDQAKLDRIQYGLNFTVEKNLSFDRTIFANLGYSRSDYVYQAFNNVNSVELAGGLTGQFSGGAQFSTRLVLGRSITPNPHTSRSFAGLELGLNRSLLEFGNLGFTASAFASHYDGIFPLLTMARRDMTVSVGLSYGDSRIRIFGKNPELNCTWRRTNSNVALYISESTDCEFALALRF